MIPEKRQLFWRRVGSIIQLGDEVMLFSRELATFHAR